MEQAWQKLYIQPYLGENMNVWNTLNAWINSGEMEYVAGGVYKVSLDILTISSQPQRQGWVEKLELLICS